MKVTDGNWMMQPGVVAFYPGKVAEAAIFNGFLDLLASREVWHRGDTLDGPTLDGRFSSPQEGVGRLKIVLANVP